MKFICDLIYATITLTLLLTIVSCSHFRKKVKYISFEELKKITVGIGTIDLSDQHKFESFLNSIKQDLIVTKKQGKILPHTWFKIGQALETYKSLAQLQVDGQLLVPQKTNLKLQLNSFCIDPNRSVPKSNEVFEWVLEKPQVPLYSKILKYYSAHPDVGRESTQELIWNLSNKTYYENYPNHLKSLLIRIDPNASKKLPSSVREKAMKTGVSVLEKISGIDLPGLISFVQGQYYNYDQFRKNLESLRSSQSLPDKQLFSKIPETNLFVTSRSMGYKNQTLGFYNPSDTPKTITLVKYYLKPMRKDVQRIALASVVGDPSYFINHLNQFFKHTLAELGGLYPNLTDEEKTLIRKHPYESLRVAWHQARSEFAMDRFFEGGSIDGEADAFRHFVWAGFLTQDLGKSLAEQYLNAHESAQSPNSPDRQMDEYNNIKGIEAALELDRRDSFSAKNLYQEAFKRLKNKELIVLKPTDKIPDDSSY